MQGRNGSVQILIAFCFKLVEFSFVHNIMKFAKQREGNSYKLILRTLRTDSTVQKVRYGTVYSDHFLIRQTRNNLEK